MGRRKPLRPYPQTRIIVRIVGGGSRTLSSFPYTWTTTLLVKVRHSDVDSSALIASASLASDHGRLLGPGEAGAKSILAPKKCADWDSAIDALGFTINSHTMRISSTYEKKKKQKRSKTFWTITGLRTDDAPKQGASSVWQGSCGTGHT